MHWVITALDLPAQGGDMSAAYVTAVLAVLIAGLATSVALRRLLLPYAAENLLKAQLREVIHDLDHDRLLGRLPDGDPDLQRLVTDAYRIRRSPGRLWRDRAAAQIPAPRRLAEHRAPEQPPAEYRRPESAPVDLRVVENSETPGTRREARTGHAATAVASRRPVLDVVRPRERRVLSPEREQARLEILQEGRERLLAAIDEYARRGLGRRLREDVQADVGTARAVSQQTPRIDRPLAVDQGPTETLPVSPATSAEPEGARSTRGNRKLTAGGLVAGGLVAAGAGIAVAADHVELVPQRAATQQAAAPVPGLAGGAGGVGDAGQAPTPVRSPAPDTSDPGNGSGRRRSAGRHIQAATRRR
jgi:hypothetical protein